MTYGSLTFIEEVPRSRHGDRQALFRCVCGKVKVWRVSAVVNGRSRSCGCVAKQRWRGLMAASAAENMANKRKREASK
jgi:hypothetical protein